MVQSRSGVTVIKDEKGYIYSFQKETKDGNKTWRCNKRRSEFKCRSYVRTRDNFIILHFYEHNHYPQIVTPLLYNWINKYIKTNSWIRYFICFQEMCMIVQSPLTKSIDLQFKIKMETNIHLLVFWKMEGEHGGVTNEKANVNVELMFKL